REPTLRMSIPGGIAACAILAALPLLSVALLSTPAFAAKESAAGFQQGGDALVMLAGAKGNVSPQRAGTAVVVKPKPVTVSPLKPPYRPTVDNPRFYPCTVHCGPPRNVVVRDHRHK